MSFFDNLIYIFNIYIFCFSPENIPLLKKKSNKSWISQKTPNILIYII